MSENHITETEYLIMKFLWSLDHDATAGEIREHFAQRNWSKQTVSTFLKRLTKSGYLKMYKISQSKYYYSILISESEHNIAPIKKVAEESFNNSFGDLICALASNEELSNNEIEKISILISQLK